MTESSELRWRKTDESDYLACFPDHHDHYLFYARIYTVRQGFNFSQTNQLIANLKKLPSVPENQLHYKRQAILQFANEVIGLLRDQLNPAQSLTIVPIPPSKTKTHSDYDDRVEQVGHWVARKLPNVSCLPMLFTVEDMESYHVGAPRDPNQLFERLRIAPAIAGDYSSGSIIALLDDVLTSGSHFAAARRRILEFFPEAQVIGIFWAKSVSLFSEPE